MGLDEPAMPRVNLILNGTPTSELYEPFGATVDARAAST